MSHAPNVSRRDAVFGGFCLCCAPGLSAGGSAASAKALPTTEIAPGIHVRRGAHQEASARNANAIANVGFIVGRDAVAVIDPGGSIADGERLRARIRQVTREPVRFVVMSHVHPDHIFGAGAFLPDEPQFLGHSQLPRALAQRGEYYRERLEEILGRGNAGPILQPTRLIEHDDEIDLGGRILRVKAHPIAHTSCDLTVLDRQSGTLFAADLLFVERIPSLDGSLKGWLAELDALAALRPSRAVPGHGPPTVDFASAARPLQHYLATLLEETRQAIVKGVEIDAAPALVAQSARGQWALFDEYHGHNVTQAFKELEWE